MARRRRRTKASLHPLSLLGRLLRTRGGRRSAMVLIVLLAAGWAYDAYLRPRYPTGPSVRIASWNLRHFSDDRTTIDVETIADVIRDNDFVILAIQEVRGEGNAVDRLRAELNGPLGIVSGRWQAILSKPTGNSERFAYLYDSDRVRFLGESGFLPARLEIDRQPFAARFRSGEFDFSLVSVHLYYSDITRRRREAQQLADLLAGSVLPAGSGERDVIVLGDFNTTRRVGGTLTPFEDHGWQVAIEGPTNLGDSETLDNLVFDPDYVREWSGRSGVVLFDEALFANDDARAAATVSDHRPVWADFVVTLEDDD